jgi:haloacetate dehalogenase
MNDSMLSLLQQDIEDANDLIECPVLALWGVDFELVGQAFDVLGVWKTMAKNVRGVAIPCCGHLPQEEQPERVNQELRDFLDGWHRWNHEVRRGRLERWWTASCR